MPVTDRLHPQPLEAGSGKLATDLLWLEGRQQGIIEVDTQYLGFACGILVYQLRRVGARAGAHQIHHHDRAAGRGELAYGAPQDGGLMQMVQQTVAHYRIVAGSRQLGAGHQPADESHARPGGTPRAGPFGEIEHGRRAVQAVHLAVRIPLGHAQGDVARATAQIEYLDSPGVIQRPDLLAEHAVRGLRRRRGLRLAARRRQKRGCANAQSSCGAHPRFSGVPVGQGNAALPAAQTGRMATTC